MSNQDNKLFEINDKQVEHEPIVIKTSMIDTSNPNGVMQSENNMISMLNMSASGSSGREDIKKQVRLLLVKHGMTLESYMGKYKDLLNMPVETEMKVADRLKLLQYLDKLNGVELNDDKSTQINNNYLMMVQNKPDDEVIGLLQEVTSKTDEYLKKMKGPSQEDKLKEINDSVHVAK